MGEGYIDRGLQGKGRKCRVSQHDIYWDRLDDDTATSFSAGHISQVSCKRLLC